MKFVFRISGGINCWDPVEDSDTGGPSSITVRMEYLRAIQYWYCEFCVENWRGRGRKHCFVNFCSLAVLESSVDEGWWGEAEKSDLGSDEILSFSSRYFSHLNQIWFKCETPLLFFPDNILLHIIWAVVRRCSSKQVSVKTFILQENNCVGVSF